MVVRHALAGAFLLMLFAAPGEKDGERIKRLVDKAGSRVSSLPELTTAAQSKWIARTAVGQDSVKSLRRYQAEASDGVYKVALVDLTWRGKVVRVGACLSPDGSIRKAGVFDEYGKEIADFAPFVKQFDKPDGVVLSDASNEDIGGVIKRRDAVMSSAKPPPKPADKKAWVLLKHHHLMWEFADCWRDLEAAAEKSDPLAPKIKAFDDQAAKIELFSENLRTAVIVPKTLGVYRDQLKELRADVAKVTELETKGDAEGARKFVKSDLKLDCGKCHGSEANEFKRPLESSLRDQLEGSGFKPGVFVVDVDLRAGKFESAEAQSLASAIKACLLAAREN